MHSAPTNKTRRPCQLDHPQPKPSTVAAAIAATATFDGDKAPAMLAAVLWIKNNVSINNYLTSKMQIKWIDYFIQFNYCVNLDSSLLFIACLLVDCWFDSVWLQASGQQAIINHSLLPISFQTTPFLRTLLSLSDANNFFCSSGKDERVLQNVTSWRSKPAAAMGCDVEEKIQ